MIEDAADVIRFDRNDYDLQEFAQFCMFTPAAESNRMVGCLNKFNRGIESWGVTPFQYVRMLVKAGKLEKRLRQIRVGRYNMIKRGLNEIAHDKELNLRTCHPDELLRITGIGRKVARMFVGYSREEAPYAVLDTHTLHWLRDEGYPDVPKATPGTKSTYEYWEDIFLAVAKRRGLTPIGLDQELWREYSNNDGGR
jgi:thermostable 8-oxoguanine DNA glycosylase